jgi:hypothetical protein
MAIWLGSIVSQDCPACGPHNLAQITSVERYTLLGFHCQRCGHEWEAHPDWGYAHHMRPPEPETPSALRLEVCRGPASGRWYICAYVPSPEIAERVLSRWRREFPGQIVALLEGGKPAEDCVQREERLSRERAEREARYFLRLAEDASREGKSARARYYRKCARRFLRGLAG